MSNILAKIVVVSLVLVGMMIPLLGVAMIIAVVVYHKATEGKQA